ncbi:hypothetical protein ACS0TY_010855 [Phlomoides rotata]
MASISAIGSLPKHFPATSAAVSPPPLSSLHIICRSSPNSTSSLEKSESSEHKPLIDRRQMVISSIGLLAVEIFNSQRNQPSIASEYADMPALRGKDYGKTKMRYPDYTETDSGLQYKDLRVGSGPTPKIGETVVVDWDGYTIGYYGRIFEARNKTKGGSFEGDDKNFYKFRLGLQEVIPAFEEAVSGMALGGIRRCCIFLYSHTSSYASILFVAICKQVIQLTCNWMYDLGLLYPQN